MPYDVKKLRDTPPKWLMRRLDDNDQVEEQQSFDSEADARAALQQAEKSTPKPKTKSRGAKP